MVKKTASTALTFLLSAILGAYMLLCPRTAVGSPPPDSTTPDTTLAQVIENLQKAQSANSSSDIIKAYNSVAWYYYNHRDFDNAIKMFQNALTISDSLGDKKNTALCYQNIGDAMAQLNLLDLSNEYNHKALNLYYELNNEEAISNICKTIGIMCIQHRLYKTATEYLNRSLVIDSVMNIRANGNLSDDIAFDYLYLGYADICKYQDTHNEKTLLQAKSKNLKAHKMLYKTRNKIGLSYSCKNLMNIYLELARCETGQERKVKLDSSLLFYNRGIKIVKDLGLQPLSFDYKLWEAKYSIETQQYDNAHTILRQIRATAEQDSTSPYIVEYGYTMADYYEAVGKYKTAYKWSMRASEIGKKQLNREFAVKSAKMTVRDEFADRIRQNEISKEHEYIIRREQEMRLAVTTATTIFVLIMITVLAYIINKSLKRNKRLGKILKERNEELETQKDQLECINDQIASSINYAHHLQTSLLPTAEQMKNLFDDTLILWRPLDIVSGDFYWAIRVGNRTLFSIADCTGHGVPGGFMSMLGISILSDITLMPEFKSGAMSAGNLLDLMRSNVTESLRQSEESQMALDGMDMAVCIIDNNTLEMQFAGAFRPVVVISGDEITEYKGDKMPISFISANPKPFNTRTISLSKGDKVFIYSDGITDQFGYGEDGEERKYASRRLLNLLKDNNSKPFDELKKIINDSIDNWRAPANKKSIAQTDDIILLGVII